MVLRRSHGSAHRLLAPSRDLYPLLMLFCYLDESGNTGNRLDDPEQPYHYLVAIMVREDMVSLLTSQLDQLASEAPTAVPLGEYHGQEMFSGRGPWDGISPKTRVQEYAKALSVIGKAEASIAHASINKPGLSRLRWQSPHLLALQFLTEKIEAWVRQKSDPLSQRALLVADQNHTEEQYAVELVREMQQSGGPVGVTRAIKRIVDGVYFSPSERSRGIQIADLVAYILNRHDRISGRVQLSTSDIAVKKLFDDYISPHCVTWRERWPR